MVVAMAENAPPVISKEIPMKLSMFVLGLSAVTVALSLTACSKKSDDGNGTTSTTGAATGGSKLRGSCTQKETIMSPKRCSEDTEKSDPLELAKGFCEGMSGTWANGACTADQRVASCAAKSGSTTYY